MSKSKALLHCCLYFTANSLSRVITRMAEEAFQKTGLSPSHAFLIMLVTDNPGIGQKELSEKLRLAPSTVTRFVDALVYKGYLTRMSEGKASNVYPTEAAKELRAPIDAACWDILGKATGQPVWMLLGGKLTDGAALYRPAPQKTPEDMLREMDLLRSDGYRHFD